MKFAIGLKQGRSIANKLMLSFCLAIGLSACLLESKEPLLMPDSGIDLFGRNFAYLRVQDNGKISIDSDGEIIFDDMAFDNGVYRSRAEHGPYATIGFHTIAGTQDLYLMQLQSFGDAKAEYLIGRMIDGKLAVKNVELDDTTLTALASSGITLVETMDNHRVKTATELQETIRLYTQINLRDFDDPDFYDAPIVIGQSEAERAALLRLATETGCLALAGHPYDPKMSVMPSQVSRGLWLNQIDINKAKIHCRIALQYDPSQSVRYAMARIHFLEDDYAKLNRSIDALMDEEFELAYVMRADNLGNGQGRDVATDDAIKLLKQRADRGSAIAQYRLGIIHASGMYDAVVDFEQAHQYYLQAAQQDFVPAYSELGLFYRNGLGVEKSHEIAFNFYMKAAARKDTAGLLGYGEALYFGWGTTENKSEAFTFLKISAEHGNPRAQYMVGFMLARGQAVEQNAKAATNWYRKASDQGDIDASSELGWHYYNGVGIDPDQQLGLQMLNAAAESGSKHARSILDTIQEQKDAETTSD